MSVTITSTAHSLTLAYPPVVLEEPAEFKVSRHTEYSILSTPISTEVVKTQARTRLRLYLDALSKAQADTLVALLGDTGLITITVLKQFPATIANPTSYQGAWAEDGRSWVKPRLAAGLPRDESATWTAVPSDLQVYHAEIELVILRNDES